ncbi:haloacid dehalogenase-like hydrolase [Citrobacter werkmanii]|uniref:HAD family hydrolase n=1 Tax=Citrobacter werkmanii TaxID=67827 RepID=UPI0019004241|nr:HAD family hydrolase [Citrobacter werkmanii]MBJ9293202.1 haloacid dehalogenase-like hydrolase [Citrobacter werkmanii]
MKTVVYDLDGTISKINTFKAWIIFSLLYSFVVLNIRDVIKIIELIVGRVLKKIDRVSFKENLLKMQNNNNWKRPGTYFANFIIPIFLRKDMMSHQNFDFRLLATAAPAIYVLPFFEKYGYFTDVICTDFDQYGVFCETLADIKAKAVLARLNNIEIDLFYTDHSDDIPLAKYSRKIILVHPTEDTINKFKLADINIPYELY